MNGRRTHRFSVQHHDGGHTNVLMVELYDENAKLLRELEEMFAKMGEVEIVMPERKGEGG